MDTKLTEKEIWVIEAIVANSYCQNNYHLPEHTLSYEEATNDGEAVWANCIDDNGAEHGEPTVGKALAGVVSALSQKGFVQCGGTGNDAQVSVTEAGWKAYQLNYHY